MPLQSLFVASGVLLLALGVPLALRRVRPNRWYGLRVPATFADEEVWYEANALAGRDLIVLGLAEMAAALLLPRITRLRPDAYAGACAALLAVGGLVVTVRGWRAANR
ncbi:MAG: SdpI family protein, partial [Geminicoccaceae bacterium]